jgi:hypothetical protein
MVGDASTPITLSARSASGYSSRPTPHPKSTATLVRKSTEKDSENPGDVIFAVRAIRGIEPTVGTPELAAEHNAGGEDACR